MIRPSYFVDILKEYGSDFYTGVPDSLLKNLCAFITDTLPSKNHIIAANEGGAMGIAAGYHLATGKIPVVYMQNSGEGNIINPLASLTDKEVYNIPVLLIIGWRGCPGVHDEPQHIKQGKITTGLLNIMGINYSILPNNEDAAAKEIDRAYKFMQRTNECYALIIQKDTFDSYKLQTVTDSNLMLSREEAIKQVASSIEDSACIVSTTGMISRELFEARSAWGQGHERDFLTVGSMGHASQIALGIAIQKPDRKIYCFDGDGASIMHMGNMTITGTMKCNNYVHIIFNNGAHDSVGGQPTVGFDIDICQIAKAVGYTAAYSVNNSTALADVLKDIKKTDGTILLNVLVKKGNRKDLGRPTTTPIQNKESFMEFLSK